MDASKCKFLPKPDIVRKRCNHHCRLEWRVASRGECSDPCGFGYQNITHRCHKIMHDSSIATVLDTYCLKELTTSKPESSVPCEGLCEGVQWSFGEWGPCSKTCGIGRQTRIVRCQHLQSGRDIQDEKCGTKNKTLNSKECNLGPCPIWETGEWSPCSVSCGLGLKERKYWCSKGGMQVEKRHCNVMTIPHHKQECVTDRQCGKWQVKDWSQCSSNCGPGERTREVNCVDSQTENRIEDTNCEKSRKPSSSSACVELSCDLDENEVFPDNSNIADLNNEAASSKDTDATETETKRRHRQRHSKNEYRRRRRYQYNLPRYRWKIGRWEDCSQQCGGIQKRVVACYDRVKGRLEQDHSRCAQVRPRPKDTQQCQSDCINADWKPGNWSLCSSSCGPGVRWRQVLCINKNTGDKISAEHCQSVEKPYPEETCGEEVICPRPLMHTKYTQIESENNKYIWRHGDWSPCSATCGGGQKARQVECFDSQGQKIEQEMCLSVMQPPSEDSCNQEPCPAWNYGQWNKCDKPCDGGVSNRLVRCQDHLGQTLPDQHCNTNTRPLDTQTCNTNTCNKFRRRRYLWKVGKWGQVKYG